MQLSAAWIRGLALSSLVTLCACTKDFSRFQFHDLAGSRDAGKIVATDSGMDAHVANNEIDGGGDTGGPDGETPRSDSGDHEGGNPGDGSMMSTEEAGLAPRPDSGTPPIKHPDKDAQAQQDARIPDKPPQDAQTAPDAEPPPDAQSVPTETQQCLDAYAEVDTSNSTCRSCTCDQCTDVALDCLVRADAYARDACTSLWRCAVRHGCQDLDCYCLKDDQRCRMTHSISGNGPCWMEMEIAAGGGRVAVDAARGGNDPNNPLVRALKAIACTVGTPAGSIGGMVTPKCKDTCNGGASPL